MGGKQNLKKIKKQSLKEYLVLKESKITNKKKTKKIYLFMVAKFKN